VRSIYLVFIFTVFFVLGAQAPFVLTLGYVWVDTFRPNVVSYSLLSQIPASMIIAVGALGSYLLLDRKNPPRINFAIILTITFAVWITLTTMWSLVPDASWRKWDWAFKTILFSAFVPFVFRSRNQIEAYLLVYAFSLAAHFLPIGLKTIISGGGYGVNLGLMSGNSSFAEGSTIATVAVSLIPILLFLKNHGRVIPKNRLTTFMYWGVIVLAIAATLGTYARTGLVGLAVVAAYLWMRSRHKTIFVVGGIILVLTSIPFLSDDWIGRMQTISEYDEESSAFTRVLVWMWTLDFVSQHPLGGGFSTYLLNTITVALPDGTEYVETGRAFHSIYFEVLGEHGYPGLMLFLGLALTCLTYLYRIIKNKSTEYEEINWSRELAIALSVSLVVVMVCGNFIGIAFQPTLYYIFSASICLYEYVHRVNKCISNTNTQVSEEEKQAHSSSAKKLRRTNAAGYGELYPSPNRHL
jgi:putative inorganic carbon (HCO3(-)) transporter